MPLTVDLYFFPCPLLRDSYCVAQSSFFPSWNCHSLPALTKLHSLSIVIMFSTKFFVAATAAFSFISSSIALYDPSSNKNVALYWVKIHNTRGQRYQLECIRDKDQIKKDCRPSIIPRTLTLFRSHLLMYSRTKATAWLARTLEMHTIEMITTRGQVVILLRINYLYDA